MKSGKIIFEDGSIYQGEFKNDQMLGSGVIKYPNGDAYVGTFDSDKKHGTGSYFDMQNMYRMQEDWVKGQRKGQVKTPTTKEEMEQQITNPGYVHNLAQTQQNIFGGKPKALKSKMHAVNFLAKNKAQVQGRYKNIL